MMKKFIISMLAALSVGGAANAYTANNDTIDISGQNTDKSYATYTTAVSIAKDKSITFITSRYTYLNFKLTGTGTMNILSGGERTFIGGSDKKYPDGTGFKGETHVYPYKKLSSSNGFYGLLWMHGGKTFSLDAALTNLDDSKAMNFFQNSTLVLHNGATMASESGVHAMRIGRLEMEAGSQLYGYMKSKAGNNTYYIIGGNNQDALLAGKMSPMSDNTDMLLGLIKEGTGTYRITGKSNNLTGGLRILAGRALINGTTTAAGLYIMQDGIGGGTGTLKGESQVYGTLQPGDDATGTFTQTGTMVLRPTARLDCQISSATSYDQIKVNGSATYYNIGQDFSTSDKMPRLRIYLTEGAELHEGDQFTLFSSTKKELYNNQEWEFDIRYPNAYTWEVEQISDAKGFRVVATVTSTKYSGQGNNGYDDADDDPNAGQDYGTFNYSLEKKDSKPLRYYADLCGTYIGTCVPVWSINVDNDSDTRTNMINKHFNMVVCENEMKFENIEPNQGQFEYYHGDRLVSQAKRNNLFVRGHTLAWHSQVAGWVTSDGTKNTYNRSRDELLSILKNHILNVVGHYKGKVKEWDVANEVLSDNQTSIYKDPKAYDLRPSVWATGIGEDFLDSAFVWAHQADPDARLILNDYGVEGKGWGKSEALYNLATRLRNSGIPIDGVGLQCHLDADLNYYSAIDKNIARYQEAGFLCHLTEMDLGITGTTTATLKMQGEAYYRLTKIAMQYPCCQSLMIWGLTDDLSWRTGKNPLLFDASNQKKQAYWGVHAALREYYEATGINDIKVDDTLRHDNGNEDQTNKKGEELNKTKKTSALIDLTGRPVRSPQRGSLYIHQGKTLLWR